MVEGLACMHGKGLAHADLKIGNVLVDEKGRAKLADFGNVKKVLTYPRSIFLRLPISTFTYHYIACIFIVCGVLCLYVSVSPA